MNNRYCKEIIKDYNNMNSMLVGFLISYGILFIYFIYLFIYFIYIMFTTNPWYERSKKEETIAIYIGIFIVGLHIVFLILYLISEL